MSSTKWVTPEVKLLTEPPLAGTIAMFATIGSLMAFRVDTLGRGDPVGQSVRNPRLGWGTTVALSRYAFGVAVGQPHALAETGQDLLCPAQP